MNSCRKHNNLLRAVHSAALLALCLVFANLSQAQDEPLFDVPAPEVDLRMMLRRYVVERTTDELRQWSVRRDQAIQTQNLDVFRKRVRQRLAEALGDLPFGKHGGPLNVRSVSQIDRGDFRVENVLFESLPGWDVNASVYLPSASRYPPPWIPVVMPVGHAGKEFRSHQIPAQVLARCGFLVVIFDAPGFGEKVSGNDHFRDGVRCYLTGTTSQRYFVIDALRAIDYLATRRDVDMSHGVGMTGVSGGGLTTIYATLLDDRITAAGPACFSSPDDKHPVEDVYAPCPESLHFCRYHDGLDAPDLLVAAEPTPVLLMGGQDDSVFRAEWSRELADDAARGYAASGHSDRFQFFLDAGGHDYTVVEALQFARWMDRWVAGRPSRELPKLNAQDVQVLPTDMFLCHPRQEENMFTLNRREAERLAGHRSETTLRAAVTQLAGLSEQKIAALTPPPAQTAAPFSLWGHNLVETLLNTDEHIWLPATLIRGSDGSGAILYFDDRGRWTNLSSGGMFTKMVVFPDAGDVKPSLLTVDLRGWGDTKPAFAPYEAAGWGAPDRWFAYMSAALGDPVLSMRIRDGLAALSYLRSLPKVDGKRIILGGHGVGALVALHVAALDSKIKGVFASDLPASFTMLTESRDFTWDQDIFLPRVLDYYDVPELVSGLQAPVLLVNPLDAVKHPIAPAEAAKLYAAALRQPGVTVKADLTPNAARLAEQEWIRAQW